MTSSSTDSLYVLRVDAAALTRFCVSALDSVGMRSEDALITAELLVRSDMRGIFTHGVVSLRRYVKLMIDGGIDPKAIPEVTGEGLAWARIDARQAVGMVAGYHGMSKAIEKARHTGLGMVGVRRSNHFGAASKYSLMALEAGMIGIAMSNTDVVMNIPGGRGAMIGNNPFSYAAPARTQPPMVLDIAMSTVAGGKVVAARNQGRAIPEGWLTDGEGLPTTDPSVFTVSGALTPFGGHKGYGMALLVETLAGVLSGAGITTDIFTWAKESALPCDEGHSFMAIHIGAMMSEDEYYTRIDTLISRMRNAPRARGSERTLVPGEIEREEENRSKTHGAPLTRMAVDSLIGLAEDTGLKNRLPFSV